MEKGKNRELILSGSLWKGILLLSVPIILNSLIQTMYNLTDTYWLGQIGKEHMAAITLVTPVQNIVTNFGSGITAAGAILISQYVGAKNMEHAKRMVGQLFVCSMLFSVLFGAGCALAAPGIVGWLGADGAVYEYSCIYLQIVILDMPFLFLMNLYTSVSQAKGDTFHPMLLNLVGIVINMLLDPLLMITLDMGVAGAALATLLAKVPCALVAFCLLRSRKQELRLELKGFRFEKEKLKSIVQIGLPTAIGSSTMQFGFLLMSKNVLEYGTAAVAAYGIGNRVNGLITMPSNAMGSATSTIVGQNVGAKQYKRAEKGYLLARNATVLFLLAGGLLLSRQAVAEPIVRIFASEAEVISLGCEFLRILALWCFTNGVYNATMGLFQGTGHTMITMAVDASRLWIFRFLTLYLCEEVFHMGVQSIWYSVVISNATSALVLFILYHTGIWKKNKVALK